MSNWPSSSATKVLNALFRIGWKLKSQAGSHKKLARAGYPNYTWAFHQGEKIGPKMLARIAKHTGLKPSDL